MQPMVAEALGDEARKALLASGAAQRRFGKPSELDSAVLYLASNSSSHTTGTVLVIDGGHACKV